MWNAPDILAIVTNSPNAMSDPRGGGEDLSQLLSHALATNPGLTQKKISEVSGIPITTINSWVKAKRGSAGNVRADVLRRLADALPQEYTVARVFKAAGRRVPGPQSETREVVLLERYRGLTEPQQQALLDIADILRKVD